MVLKMIVPLEEKLPSHTCVVVGKRKIRLFSENKSNCHNDRAINHMN